MIKFSKYRSSSGIISNYLNLSNDELQKLLNEEFDQFIKEINENFVKNSSINQFMNNLNLEVKTLLIS